MTCGVCYCGSGSQNKKQFSACPGYINKENMPIIVQLLNLQQGREKRRYQHLVREEEVGGGKEGRKGGVILHNSCSSQ